MKKYIIFLFLLVMVLVFGCTQTAQIEQEPTDPSLLEIKERGTLIVGTSPPYGPMEFYDESGDIVGIDVDIAEEIASQLGVELEVRDIDFDTLLESVDSGEADVAIAAITITSERSNEQLVSIPYFSGGQTIVVRADEKTIKAAADLNGRKFGVEDDGTSLKDAVFEHVENPSVQLYMESEGSPYTAKVVAELQDNAIDAFVVDYIAAIDIVKENPDLKILGEPFTQEYYGIATKRGNEALMSEINEVLREMKRSGKLKEIENKWLS